MPCAGPVLENLTRGLARPHPGGCVCQEKVILHGAPHQAEEFVSVGSTEACWSGGFAFSGRPVSLITGPGPPPPGTLCSLLNAAQAMSAPGWPEGCRGWGLSHSFSCGCMWQGPPRPQPATAPLSCHAAVAGTGVLVPLWLFSELKLLTVTSLQSQFT